MNKKYLPLLLLLIISILALLFISFNVEQKQSYNFIDLSGAWLFKLDPEDNGLKEKWYSKNISDDTIFLPGSTITNKKGFKPNINTKWTGSIYDSSWYFDPAMEKYRKEGKFPFWLTPEYYYVGPAWYTKTISINKKDSRRYILLLERPHWETNLWVNNKFVGKQNSLSTPHYYDITDFIIKGNNTITIMIDNRIKEINVGPDSHSITDHTQGNWNGIVGKIGIKILPQIFIETVKIIPDITNKKIKTIIKIKNFKNADITGKLIINANEIEKTQKFSSLKEKIKLKQGINYIEKEYKLGENARLWDEFNPIIYNLNITIKVKNYKHTLTEYFGLREVKVSGRQILINNKPVLLRGTVECAAHPLTGYPPCNVDYWLKIFKKCKEYGLNHVRFHSWCPPKEAFIAADLTGIYLQVEGPSWANHGVTLGDGLPIDTFLYNETERIINEYGNHPSFCLFAYGNEPAGRNHIKYLNDFVKFWKNKDSRFIYTHASIGRSWPLASENQFIVRSEARGLPWDSLPNNNFDYSNIIKKYNIPYISHEMGQYCAFPNLKETIQYIGPYKARNFEIFSDILCKKSMCHQADDFLKASGILQLLCYKNEIEASLRTPGNAGFQLLSLNDFPGQGTAIVGILNAFWQEKGYANSKDFKKFCNDIVLLTRIRKFIYTNNENLNFEIEISNFRKELKNQIIRCYLMDNANKEHYFKEIKVDNIPLGLSKIENVNISLNNFKKAIQLKLIIRLNEEIENDWRVWVYPYKIEEIDTTNIHVCRKPDEKMKEVLKKGGKVLLLGSGYVQYGKNVIQYFTPVFWNTSWFQMRPPHTLGLLIKNDHPIFKDFPTSFHSDIQWWELVHKQQVMIIDSFPNNFSPIVQPIDTWFLNRRLAILFEAKVFNGKIIVCSSDLFNNLDKRIVARQLLYSIVNYMNSDKFNPIFELDYKRIQEIFEDKNWPDWKPFTKHKPDELRPTKNNNIN